MNLNISTKFLNILNKVMLNMNENHNNSLNDSLTAINNMNFSTSYEIQNFTGYEIEIQENGQENNKKYLVKNRNKTRYFYNINQDTLENDFNEVFFIKNVKVIFRLIFQ